MLADIMTHWFSSMKSLSGYSSRENWTNETVACCHSSISVLYRTEFLNNIFHFNPFKSHKIYRFTEFYLKTTLHHNFWFCCDKNYANYKITDSSKMQQK